MSFHQDEVPSDAEGNDRFDLSSPDAGPFSEEEPEDSESDLKHPQQKGKWPRQVSTSLGLGFTGDSTPSESNADGLLPRDRQIRTAYYDPAVERQLSHIEARQLYQRLQQENQIQTQSESQSPVLQSSVASSTFIDPSLSRAGTINSWPSTQSLAQSSSLQHLVETPSRGQRQEPQQHSQYAPIQDGPKDAYVQNDIDARKHSHRPHLPHEDKPLLASEGLHGAGAGVGVGAGLGGFAASDAYIASELTAIYSKVKRVLDLRRKYIELSLQGPYDNPKDQSGWRIYPPPPERVWDHRRERLDHGQTTEDAKTDAPSKKARKAGVDIGEDFDIDDLLPVPPPSDMTFRLDKSGVYQVYLSEEDEQKQVPAVKVPTLRDYYMDLDEILSASSDGPSKSFAFRRLQYLESKFNLYMLLNEYQEMADSKKVPHRDFYNVRKVDTHVHHSACMNQKHLLRFIKSKMKKCPDEKVLFRDDKVLTLKEVFESINLTAYDLSIDTLDMHAHTDSFHRFDKFNLKYNPVGESRLRTIFLKTDNYIKGRYLAEITKEVIEDLESSKYQMVEWRISIYGRSMDDWDKLAAWVVDNKLFSHNVRWLIQFPRLYDVYKSSGLMEDFQQVIVNFFQPLFEVTKDPSSHPKLHIFLQRVIGFDSVDDESKPERRLYRKFPYPKDWNTAQNPPYSYWIYYLFANTASLNFWRKERGFNTLLVRPHCGEAGDTDHLAAATLCCHSISHGLTLRKVPLLQYIFYLEQIGIAMSPLSNNALFLTYERNPFPQYFRRGLNVSLSTDDPLQFAFTREPLIEEYSVAAQIYKLNAVDMCELAKHSVEQSGFEHEIKQRWLGDNYHLPGVSGNDVAKVNVPDIREGFRHETLLQELAMVRRYTQPPPSGSVQGPAGQFSRESPRTNRSSRSSTVVPDGTPGTFQRLPMAALRYQGNRGSGTFNHTETTGQSVSRSATASSTNADANALGAPLQLWASPDTSLSRTESIDHLDGSEPKLFPGVVHRAEGVRRRNSLRRSSVSLDETGSADGSSAGGWGASSLGSLRKASTFEGGAPEAVVEDDESD